MSILHVFLMQTKWKSACLVGSCYLLHQNTPSRWPKITPKRHGSPVKKGPNLIETGIKTSSSPTRFFSLLHVSFWSSTFSSHHRHFFCQERFQCLQSVRSVDTEAISFSLLGHIRSQALRFWAPKWRNTIPYNPWTGIYIPT